MTNSRRKFIKDYFLLAVPIMLQQLSGNILNICDTIMVGHISSEAISAVTVANKMYFIYILLIFGTASAISVFMSQYYGAGEKLLSKKTLKFGLEICLGISLVFFLILSIFPSTLMRIFVDGENLIVLGTDYISFIRWSYIPIAVSQMMAIYYRVFKKPNIPMFTSAFSVALNIVLNYILIFGHLGIPAMGIEGAALATLIARCTECLILFSIFIKKENGKEVFMKGAKGLTWEKRILIVRKTVPLMMNEGIWALSLSLIFRNYCLVSERYIPAITVVDNVFDLVNVTFFGCSLASEIIIGKILGTGEMDQAKRVAKRLILMGLGVSLFVSFTVASLAPTIPGLFSLSGDLFRMATTLLFIKAAFSWSTGFGETVYYILRAGGDVKAVLLLDGLFMLYGPFLISTIVSHGTDWPIQMVYLCTEAAYILKIFIALYFFRKGNWCTNLTKK